MATHTKTVSITDLQQKILSNDLYNDTSNNAGLDDWIQKAFDGKLNNCWKRFRQEWTQKLMDDDFARIYDTTSQSGKLASHIYVLGSYTYDINPAVSIEPSFFLKSVSGAKTQIDIGLKSEYKKLFWLGMNYNMNNDFSSIAALLGFNINDRYNIGYSYGMPSSATSNYYSGSHEFMLGIKFPH